MFRRLAICLLAVSASSSALGAGTISFYAKPSCSTGWPHAWLRIEGEFAGKNVDEWWDFQPEDSANWVRVVLGTEGGLGNPEGAYAGREKMTLRRNLSDKQYEAVQRKIKQWIDTEKTYSVLQKNCISFTNDVAKEAGLSTPDASYETNPIDWMTDLYKKNPDAVLIDGAKPANPRDAVDAFKADNERSMIDDVKSFYEKFKGVLLDDVSDGVQEAKRSSQYRSSLVERSRRGWFADDNKRNVAVRSEVQYAVARQEAAAEAFRKSILPNSGMTGSDVWISYGGGGAGGDAGGGDAGTSPKGDPNCAAFVCLRYEHRHRAPIYMPLRSRTDERALPLYAANDAPEPPFDWDPTCTDQIEKWAEWDAMMEPRRKLAQVHMNGVTSSAPVIYLSLGNVLKDEVYNVNLLALGRKPGDVIQARIFNAEGGNRTVNLPTMPGGPPLIEAAFRIREVPSSDDAQYIELSLNGVSSNIIYLVYELFEAGDVKIRRQLPVESGLGKGWSRWYRLSTGPAPFGYTLKRDFRYGFTHDRTCGAWAACALQRMSDGGAVAQFSIQGREGNFFRMDQTLKIQAYIEADFELDRSGAELLNVDGPEPPTDLCDKVSWPQ